jgi:hypothetical protein
MFRAARRRAPSPPIRLADCEQVFGLRQEREVAAAQPFGRNHPAEDLVRLVISRGVDENGRDPHLRGALHRAVSPLKQGLGLAQRRLRNRVIASAIRPSSLVKGEVRSGQEVDVVAGSVDDRDCFADQCFVA